MDKPPYRYSKLDHPNFIETRHETATEPDPARYLAGLAAWWHLRLYERDHELVRLIDAIGAMQQIYPTLPRRITERLPDIRAALPGPVQRSADNAERDLSILRHALEEQYKWMEKAWLDFEKKHRHDKDKFNPHPRFNGRLGNFYGHGDAQERIAQAHHVSIAVVRKVLSSFRGASDDQLETLGKSHGPVLP